MKMDEFTKTSTFKKFHKVGEFSGSYSRGQSSGCYPVRPIQLPINIFPTLEGISRLFPLQRYLHLTPRHVLDVQRLDILGNIV